MKISELYDHAISRVKANASDKTEAERIARRYERDLGFDARRLMVEAGVLPRPLEDYR